MELTRQELIDRCQSKVSSIEEFNFDMLTAPPLSMLLTQSDIDRLYYIATSVKYSGNPKKKYEAIDAIMNPRGFIKLSAGTNRVVYRHLESNDFVVKVAADDVGIGDNPREFKNQFIFKPFVTKVFEVSPCGTVGVFERVKPIRSREEFLSIADDIYDVINEWFIGKYIMADIGTKFFMNWGIRHYNSFREGSVAFGPVLLDFPYVYELDGNKLFCSAVDYNSSNGRCGGVIDYDDGFNYLICSKCGVKYRVRELAKNIEEQKIVYNKTGRSSKMKIGHYKNGQVICNNEVVEKKPVNKVSRDIIKAPSKPVGSFKMNTPGKVSAPVVEKPVEKKTEPGTNRGIVKTTVSDNEAVAKEYQNIIENKNETPSFKEIAENREFTFSSYEAEYDIVTLTNGASEITAKLSDIIPEEEKQNIIESSAEYMELENARKDISAFQLSDSEKSEEIKKLKAEAKDLAKTIEELNAEIKKLKETTKGTPESITIGEVSISTKINAAYEGVDTRYYGDAMVLDGIVDSINGYSDPEIPGRNVVVFPGSDGDFFTDDKGNIICVASINGYLIDDLIKKVEEPKEEK